MILFNLWLGELRFSDIKRTCPKNRTVYYLLSNGRYTKRVSNSRQPENLMNEMKMRWPARMEHYGLNGAKPMFRPG